MGQVKEGQIIKEGEDLTVSYCLEPTANTGRKVYPMGRHTNTEQNITELAFLHTRYNSHDQRYYMTYEKQSSTDCNTDYRQRP